MRRCLSWVKSRRFVMEKSSLFAIPSLAFGQCVVHVNQVSNGLKQQGAQWPLPCKETL